MDPMDDSTALRPGARLDRYDLLCPIASGGMASVWLARLRGKRGFEKLVAIKTIRAELVDDERFEAMFLDEARIASGIQHPNVAQIIDLGEQDEILYLVMEWVDGDSLAKIRRAATKRGHPLPLGVALRVMADACAGLHAAHELKDSRGVPLGVVHRDVSPQNIMVGSSGVVKVIDFGVAKAKNRGAGETRTGVVKGKIHYMAPEQAQAREVDRRVDVWAIGVCLHELVTGKVPFDSDSDVEVLRRLMGTESPPRITGIAVPEAVDEILSHSLVRDPDERFATAAAMQRALETAIDELGLPSTSEDVADFVRAHVPDLAAKRQSVVTAALADADSRPSAGGTSDRPTTPGRDEIAFAPTVMSGRSDPRRAPPDVDTVALVKRKTPAIAAPPRGEESKATLGSAALSTDDEELVPAGVPRRRGWVWVALLCSVAAAGWWAREHDGVARARAWLAAISGPPSMPAPPTAVPAASPPAPSPSASTARVQPSAVPSASATPSAPPVDAGTRADAAVAHKLHWPVPHAAPEQATAPPSEAPATPAPSASPTGEPPTPASDNPYD